jgi:hypothetical protein
MRLKAFLAAFLLSTAAHAQFTPGQVLTAAQLNSTLAGKASTGTAGTSQLQYLQGATGSAALSLTTKLQQIVNAADFGAVCSGSGDDTAGIQAAALVATRVELPAGNCIVSSSITSSTAVTFSGRGMSATTITPTGSFDVFAFSGNVNGGGVRDLTIKAAAMTGGNVISNNGQGRFTLHNLQIVNGYNGIYLQDFNVVTIDNVWINAQTGAYSVKAYGSAVGSANVLDMNNVEIGFSTNTASSPIGVWIDGGVATVDMRHVAVVKGYRGIQITNTGNISPGPGFVTAYSFQSDFPYAEGIYADGGTTATGTLQFMNPYVHQSQSAAGVQFTSTASNVSVYGGQIDGNFMQGILTNGRFVKLGDVNVSNNSQAGSATYPGIEIGASSIGTTIHGGLSGVWTGHAANLQSYGAQTDAGSTFYTVQGVNLNGNVTAPYLDNAADSNSQIAFNMGSTAVNKVSGVIQAASGNLTIRTTSASNFVNLGSSSGGTGFSAQAPTSSVNFVRSFGSVTGTAPVLQAVGTDTNIGLNLATTGTGAVFTAAIFNPQAGVLLPTTTVSSLPTCGTSQKGLMYAVSDATTPTYNNTLTGGGAVSVPVYCNGTAWTSH